MVKITPCCTKQNRIDIKHPIIRHVSSLGGFILFHHVLSIPTGQISSMSVVSTLNKPTTNIDFTLHSLKTTSPLENILSRKEISSSNETTREQHEPLSRSFHNILLSGCMKVANILNWRVSNFKKNLNSLNKLSNPPWTHSKQDHLRCVVRIYFGNFWTTGQAKNMRCWQVSNNFLKHMSKLQTLIGI